MMNGQITTIEAIRNFFLAGDATFTLVSKKTGARKTFRVEETPQDPQKAAATGRPITQSPGYFVRLLVGPENTSDYRYLGFLYEHDSVLRVKPNKQGWGDEACRAFEWLVNRINDRHDFSDEAEFWHEGRCARCGRPLTVPESIASGIGPVCAGRM